MKKIDEIDFSALYRHHFKELDRPISRPEQWDARAEKITSDWQPSDYVYALLEGMQLQNKETVLDVGAGAGDITLAVAMRGHEVHALDFSEKMLERLRQRADVLGCAQQITTHCYDWTDAQIPMPQCDVVVASRSSLIADMERGLERLHHLARKRVYVTYPFEAGRRTGPEFSRNHVGAGRIPPYFYLPAILYQRGQRPEIDFIEESIAGQGNQIRWVLISWKKQPWLASMGNAD